MNWNLWKNLSNIFPAFSSTNYKYEMLLATHRFITPYRFEGKVNTENGKELCNWLYVYKFEETLLNFIKCVITPLSYGLYTYNKKTCLKYKKKLRRSRRPVSKVDLKGQCRYFDQGVQGSLDLPKERVYSLTLKFASGAELWKEWKKIPVTF